MVAPERHPDRLPQRRSITATWAGQTETKSQAMSGATVTVPLWM